MTRLREWRKARNAARYQRWLMAAACKPGCSCRGRVA